MRILLSDAGWPGSDDGTAVAAGHAWPQGSVIRVATVIGPPAALPTWPSLAQAREEAARLRLAAEDSQSTIVERIRASGWPVDGTILHGPARARIVEAANAFRADLLIIGARADGMMASGAESVAADLVDTARCPVLVARGPSISRLVLATDGSAGAQSAEGHLLDSPALARVPTVVVSVAETRHVLSATFAPALGQFEADEIKARVAAHRRFADEAARRLARDGREVRVLVRVGDVAREIAAAVTESAADLVVVGSDRHRGLSRILLGSVARDVMARTDASLLVVRTPPRAVGEVLARPGSAQHPLEG
jgi:nucleotide-binding universal stress UspA family protein